MPVEKRMPSNKINILSGMGVSQLNIGEDRIDER
jgi:hypothetical protein